MVKPLMQLLLKVWLLAAVSTVFLAVATARAPAHEILTTIANMTVSADRQITLSFRLNLEAFLAGIDLDAVEDTDADDAAVEYDALRALSAAELAQRAGEVIAKWNSLPIVHASVDVPLDLAGLIIPDDVKFELPRVSVMTLTGVVPESAPSVIVNWPSGSGALVLRQEGVKSPYTGYLNGGDSSPAIALTGGDAQSTGAAFASYIPVGFDHILPKGLDHILFVLGLFFLSTRMGPLLWQISAFTLAHTVTLALGALGWVSIPGNIVEPLIAASIVYVAVENLFQRGLNRWRPLVIFGFGLLHGLGFASVLGEFGVPEDQFIPALVGFNVGVELGQLTVISIAALILLGCTALARRSALTEAEQPVGTYVVMFRAVSIPASLFIAVIGAYWCVERVFL